ncbi:DEAD/DEAH box helicase [Fulvivirga sedimenti]|uniref:RNA helicase n=1 Tax=Fulvivirga sedimenti TaxID=2879465 RepID=A0A9X1KYZ4_9BACT|nr:DEAD/DEAH box helicase [Fulvivirga sedimenti]MCA6074515.1 DEAD/DEAH box helicase [Fulvivirga sedimenti]MCA6075692.1 DEAD/DEAH box helicase [Fulvivirga sedimenti]MCA6076820.1 DEAD/DEAH box helicase [Fulvivirga sedimenti]
MNKFKKLGLSKNVLDVLEDLGFDTPTPVQEQAIPILLQNDPTNFIGLAQTGTGKTAAFGLPLIDLIDNENKATQALIMAPTRELGQQTAKQLSDFSANNRLLNIEVVYGGAAITNQIKALRKPTQILVATPGRLLDLIKRRAVNLEHVRYVVLDEADEMLNMGFKEDIDEILSHTREERVTWLFSATMPREIRRIVKKYMVNPKEVSINAEEKSNKDIAHKYVVTKTSNKIPALRRFLDMQPDMRGIMFCRTKRETQQIADDLGNMGYGVEALHGDLSQAQRDAVMKRFKTRSMQLLIATDVAARGIDVNDLTHVIHHTLPDQLESYTHRSGRTGRAGKKGISLAFINAREGRKIKELEKTINITFEKIEVPALDEMKISRINHWADLIINTKVDDQAEIILAKLHGQFAHLSKEDILKRLITTQLDHLITQEGETSDLNEQFGEKKETRSSNGFHRYFINVGSIDGITKGDLLHFLSDISDIPRKHFGELSLQKNCAFFDIEESKSQGLSEKFEGIEVEGRNIRVNRDEQGGRKPEGGRSRGKKEGNSNRRVKKGSRRLARGRR